ncbi:histidine phosphatase family protein [Mastigocoleus sp. MO_188.B34]|uniref:histidine phosphatase family protein n=1 Tax=Mastigocoleus sp. MO_188.B34 TaxID=3036635 RepID=UPI002639F1DF|nr:histidine phosphatase family protein [Mastigocoleus sp. MO_188.B34]MDJ0695132.1 histidine phosphatase family protein [Mastigocoleus sp. MO_188.B34]
MISIWLIRHGESEANAGLPTSDVALINLTEKGHQQAKKAVSAFTQAPSLIVTSPYIRTKQTAQPTVERFTSTPQTEWLVHEFTYLSLDRRHNTTAKERLPMSESYWERCDPNYVDGIGAESFADMIQRVQDFRQKIYRLEEEFTAVFTHETFIRAFLWLMLSNAVEINSKTMEEFQAFIKSLRIPNCGIVKLECRNSEIWLNGVSTSHLSR